METLSTTVCISDSVVHAVLGDETVLLDSDSGVYYGLDAVGSRIWELLAHGSSEEEVVRTLLLEYRAVPEQVRADVEECLRGLASKRLTRAARR